MSSVQRKCWSCGTWNPGENANCSACGALIDPVMRLADDAAQREKKRMLAPRSHLDRFIEKFKKSRNPFVKVAFAILSAIWFVYWVFLSFILWLIAAGPG